MKNLFHTFSKCLCGIRFSATGGRVQRSSNSATPADDSNGNGIAVARGVGLQRGLIFNIFDYALDQLPTNFEEGDLSAAVGRFTEEAGDRKRAWALMALAIANTEMTLTEQQKEWINKHASSQSTTTSEREDALQWIVQRKTIRDLASLRKDVDRVNETSSSILSAINSLLLQQQPTTGGNDAARPSPRVASEDQVSARVSLTREKSMELLQSD